MKKINLPNALVLVRLALVPVIILLLMFPPMYTNNGVDVWAGYDIKNVGHVYWTDVAAGILFIIASITDFVDGWYARKYNQITTFGKLFDPLADKILVNSVLIIFGARGIIPISFVIIFVCRDILVDGLRMMLASNQIVLAADRYGKLKTIFQMIGLSLLFFIHSGTPDIQFFSIFNWHSVWNTILITPLSIGLAFSIYSGINYYVNGFEQLKNKNQ